MINRVGYHWHLRTLMADRGLFKTTELAPLLAERGVELSPAQVHRLVTQAPERITMATLVALCDALDCTPADLIEPYVAKSTRAGKAANAASQAPEVRNKRPTRARITPA